MSLQDLYDACISGDLETVQDLVEISGVNFHAEQENALRLAVINNHVDIVEYLVEQGANIEVWRASPLRRAAENGFLSIVQYLIGQNANIHVYNNNPLHLACRNGHLDVVQNLISEGADAHALNDRALVEAIIGDHADIVAYLITLNADVQVGLEGAAFYNSQTWVDYFITNGAVISHNDHAALVSACRSDNLSMVQYLVNTYSADASTPEALFQATINGNLPIVEFLFAEGASLFVQDSKAFILACQHNHPTLIQFYVDQLVDTRAQNDIALIMVAQHGLLVYLDLFLTNGADPHIQSDDPITTASQFGHLDCVESLVAALGTPQVAALYLAIENQHLDVVDYLMDTHELEIQTVAEFSELLLRVSNPTRIHALFWNITAHILVIDEFSSDLHRVITFVYDFFIAGENLSNPIINVYE